VELTTENTMKIIGKDSVTIIDIAVIYCGFGPTMPEVPLNRPPNRFWVKWEARASAWSNPDIARYLAGEAGWPDGDHVFEKEIEASGANLNAGQPGMYHWFWVCAGSEYVTPPPKEDS
jgi:hypothetical protein